MEVLANRNQVLPFPGTLRAGMGIPSRNEEDEPSNLGHSRARLTDHLRWDIDLARALPCLCNSCIARVMHTHLALPSSTYRLTATAAQ
jgi:hypothetical protein